MRGNDAGLLVHAFELRVASLIGEQEIQDLCNNYTQQNQIGNAFSAIIVEYTVSPNNRHEVNYGVRNEKIFKSGRDDGEKDTEKIAAIKKVIEDNIKEIKKVDAEEAPNYKGGRQKLLTINFNNETFHIIGNTPNTESDNLYQRIKSAIEKIVFPEFFEFSIAIIEKVMQPDASTKQLNYKITEKFGIRDNSIFSLDHKSPLDDIKLQAAQQIINENMDKIKHVCNKHLQPPVNNVSKIIKIRINHETYEIIGNTNDLDSRNLYESLKQSMKKVLLDFIVPKPASTQKGFIRKYKTDGTEEEIAIDLPTSCQ